MKIKEIRKNNYNHFFTEHNLINIKQYIYNMMLHEKYDAI